jgi:hypothetical protein
MKKKQNPHDLALIPSLEDCDSEPIIARILQPLGLPRDVLAAPKDIGRVWNNLPDLLNDVHSNYRNALLARTIVALRVGLFPSAINELWNLVILALRGRIRKFGYKEAKPFTNRDIDDSSIGDLKDHELLDICVKLGLLSAEDYFFLMHNKEIRNNYSAAHPSDGMLDGHQITNFINSCVKYVLSKEEESVGIDIHAFIKAIKSKGLDDEELKILAEKIKNSFEIQRAGVLTALFGIFCDPDSDEYVRTNCQDLLKLAWEDFSDLSIGRVLSIYSEYVISDSEKRDLARELFRALGKIDLLPKEERFHMMQKAIKALEDAHHNFDNFYTEVPLAENLASMHKHLPETLYAEYVETVTLCFVGNIYGTSRGALPYYKEMVGNFTAKQIDILVALYKKDSLVRNRVRSTARCRQQFTALANVLPDRNISAKARVEIDNVKKGTFR